MIKQAKLSNKCQITVPKEIRNFLEIDKGDNVVFYIEDNEIKLTSVRNVSLNLRNANKKTTIKKEKNNEKKWYYINNRQWLFS